MFQHDGLPECICRNCINLIDISVNFRKLCESTDKILRSNLHLLKTQIKNEVEDEDCDFFDNYEDFPGNKSTIVEDTKRRRSSHEHKFKSGKKRKKKTLSEIKLKRLRKQQKKEIKTETIESIEPTSVSRKGFSEAGGLCPFCGKVYVKMASFNTHVKKHTLTECFSCETCSKSFKELKRLKDHERTHLNIREYSCEVCGKLFGTKSCAKKHLERVHLRSQVVHCKICNKKLAHMNSLRVSMRF